MDEDRPREQTTNPPRAEARERWPSGGSGRPNSKIRILIVDDHAILRQALRLLLEIHDDVEVVGDAANGREAMDAAEKLQPDVVLMDMVMPGLNGLEATRQIRRRLPKTKVRS